MIDILMPRLSDTMEEGAIAVWHKKPGDRVDVGDVLVEIETDKATMEYEAYEAGILHDVLVPEGDLATIGMIIARLDDGSPQASASPASAPEVASAPAPVAPEEDHPAQGDVPPSAERGRVLATPLVRRLAHESNIDLALIAGSGPGGRIVRADLEEALEQRPTAAPASADRDTPRPVPAGPLADSADTRASTRVPFDRTREVISRRLAESSSATPHFSVTAVADVERLLALRADLNARQEAKDRSRLSVNDLVIRAAAVALREHPGVNASYSAEGRGQTLLHGHVNIGIAVASPTGLVVPVIAAADLKTASQIAEDSRRLASLAQDRGLRAADMSGGTFTVSNLGMFGVEQFTAIINPPEGAILAVGAALPEPVAIDGAVEIRRRMRLTLSADHRIIDGALAARFLATLTELLEHPLDLLV
jgi:pyruvate dehydrogenase E2 component (dihydrolipoamide acetyltransferase)